MSKANISKQMTIKGVEVNLGPDPVYGHVTMVDGDRDEYVFEVKRAFAIAAAAGLGEQVFVSLEFCSNRWPNGLGEDDVDGGED